MRPESHPGTSRSAATRAAGPHRANLRRHSDGDQRASNIELFFDLVYLFAITQLSRFVLDHHESASGVGHAALLLGMVWTIWSFTMWVTNWLDPDRPLLRLTLIAMMAASLVLSAGIPEAFTTRGAWIGISYAVMQVGRSAIATYGLRGDPLENNFLRITVWCVASGALAIVGGEVGGSARVWFWLGAVGVDMLGGPFGFPVPGLGRSTSSDWVVEGHHIAERCQAFILIALGESIVRIGETLADQEHLTHGQVAAFIGAFVGAVSLWWIYFDRSADAATEIVVGSDDPGAIARSAYHMIHPLMVAGIIATAAADEVVVADPSATTYMRGTWLILGGVGLFLLGHAAFKYAVWRVLPWARLAGVVVLLGLSGLSGHVSQLTLGSLAGAVGLAVAVSDHFIYPLPVTDKVQTG